MGGVLNDLVVLHQPAKSGEKWPVAVNGIEWQTCLRRIVLLHESESSALIPTLPKAAEIYRGQAAYNFLLEVICGLRSPLVAETAVMGQFKEFCARAKFPSNEWGHFLRHMTSDLLVDAKRVRSRHLEGLGSQSYGGMVRQHLKGVPSVIVLGAGQLAEEILPWIAGKTDVTVCARNPQRARALKEHHSEIKIAPFATNGALQESRPTAIVIAAPINASDVELWMRAQSTPFVKVIDLRGEAETDPLRSSLPVIRLSEMFAALQNERPKLAARVAAARDEIKKAAQRLIEQAQFRPFGWEDLCA
jgi:glutamyl-tRNA reductase